MIIRYFALLKMDIWHLEPFIKYICLPQTKKLLGHNVVILVPLL